MKEVTAARKKVLRICFACKKIKKKKSLSIYHCTLNTIFIVINLQYTDFENNIIIIFDSIIDQL